MTETDAVRKPLSMPEKYIPYLEKHRVYLLLKDMLRDLILDLPRDHLKHLKVFLNRHQLCNKGADRILLLASPEINIDIKRVTKEMIKDLGLFVITRRCVMDRYEKHEHYEEGCVSPVLMSEVTKSLTMKEPVPVIGWLMFDHPCTVREARCMQQDGILPTVTLVLMPRPPQAPPAQNPLTPSRNFFQQDFEGLKFAYKATLKEVYIDPGDETVEISLKCFNAIAASTAGLQGPLQGHHVIGAPGTYRVLLIGPRGCGRRTQAAMLARHFGLVNVNFTDLLEEAHERKDEIGEKLRGNLTTITFKAQVVQRRLLQKDCVDNGWVLTDYPNCSHDFEKLVALTTPPNRILFLNSDKETCKKRLLSQGIDWCSGQRVPNVGSNPNVLMHPKDNEEQLEAELDQYFSETLAELHAAAGLSAVEINGNDPTDQVQVKLQAAVIAAPAFDIECCSQIRNVHGE